MSDQATRDHPPFSDSALTETSVRTNWIIQSYWGLKHHVHLLPMDTHETVRDLLIGRYENSCGCFSHGFTLGFSWRRNLKLVFPLWSFLHPSAGSTGDEWGSCLGTRDDGGLEKRLDRWTNCGTCARYVSRLRPIISSLRPRTHEFFKLISALESSRTKSSMDG